MARDINSTDFSGDVTNKLQNFWYYYKWHTLIGGFMLLFLLVCISQCMSANAPHVNVLYAGPAPAFSQLMYDDLTKNFAKVLDKDLNGDKKVIVGFEQFRLLSQEDMNELGNDAMLSPQEQSVIRRQFDAEVMSGKCVVYFLAPDVYYDLQANKMLLKWEDAIGYKPSKAFDDYGVNLKDLEVFKYYFGIGDLPPDTIMCMRAYTVLDNKKTQQRYEDNFEFVKKLKEFRKAAMG